MSKKKPHHNIGNQYAIKEVTKDVYLQIRLTAEKREQYKQAASDEGLTLSEWVLSSCENRLKK